VESLLTDSLPRRNRPAVGFTSKNRLASDWSFSYRKDEVKYGSLRNHVYAKVSFSFLLCYYPSDEKFFYGHRSGLLLPTLLIQSRAKAWLNKRCEAHTTLCCACYEDFRLRIMGNQKDGFTYTSETTNQRIVWLFSIVRLGILE